MRSRVGTAGAVLATVLLLAACGSGATGGSPVVGDGASSAPSTADSGTSEGAAPPVGDPLDVNPIVSAPCDALSSSDLGRLGLAGGEEREISTAEGELACSWDYADESGNRIDLSAVPNTGLSTIYERRSTNEYFEETEVSGYPAVHTATLDERDDGGCGLWVGVSDQSSLFILTSINDGPDVSDPCPVADTVAEAAIATLGG